MSSPSSVAALLGDSGAQVLPNLFLGDKKLAANLDALQTLGVTHVVNATVDVRNYFEKLDESQGHLPITYLRCACHDTDQADLSQHFDTACDFIDAALGSGHRVLVHCQQGISRSSTLTIAYLIRSRALTVSDAYMLVRTARLQAKPKGNFIRQLVKFEQRLKKQAAVAAPAPAAAASVAAAPAASLAPPPPPPAAAVASSASASHPHLHGHPTLVVNVAPGLVMVREGDPQSHNPIDEEIERERKSKEAAAAASAATAATAADKQQQASKRKQRRENGDDAAPPSAATDASAAASAAAAAASTVAMAAAGLPLDSPPSGMTAREDENQQKRRRIITGAESAAMAASAEANAVVAASSSSSSASSAAAVPSPCVSPPSLTQLALGSLSPAEPSLYPHVHQSHKPDTSESNRTVDAMLEADRQQQEHKEQEQ